MSLLTARSLILGIWILSSSENDLLAQQHPIKVQYEIKRKLINSNDILSIPIPSADIRNITKMTVLYQGGKALRYFETDNANSTEVHMPVKYSFIEADSGYYIIEDPENENLYKCAFPTRVLYRSNQRKSLLSIDCEEYFNVANADTSFYYLTNSLPKSAGVVQFKNIESCIFGISDNYASIFPIGIKGEVKELISLPNKSIQIINSIDSNLVNGRTGGISIGKQFPRFVAKDVHGKKVSSADFQNHNSSVVIFWDHIKSKEVGNPKKIQYEKYYNDQIEEILLALDSVCMLKAAELFSFSTEYLENISKPRYFFVDHLKCLHFVTNSDRWQSRLNIIADPLIILINNKGSITEILSPLDFPEENLVGFFIERISEKAKGQ